MKFKRFICIVLLIAACHNDTAPIPEPIGIIPPKPKSLCFAEDDTALAWAQKLNAAGYILTTYWYDSTGPHTVQGISGHGCLAGFSTYIRSIQ